MGGTGVANKLGVSQAIIALTIVALGTSLPEIATTVMAAIRRQHTLAVANVVGSNLLNLGLVLAVSGLIRPLQTMDIGVVPLTALIGSTLLMGLLAWRPGYYPRWSGAVFISVYGVYTYSLIG